MVRGRENRAQQAGSCGWPQVEAVAHHGERFNRRRQESQRFVECDLNRYSSSPSSVKFLGSGCLLVRRELLGVVTNTVIESSQCNYSCLGFFELLRCSPYDRIIKQVNANWRGDTADKFRWRLLNVSWVVINAIFEFHSAHVY